jgi:hypothetical protein
MGNRFCTILLAAIAGAYLLRRQGLRWGATDEEVHKPLPGDEIVSHPMIETTHALTVRAGASEVWPWLVQVGYYRAGWYTDPSWWDRPVDEYLKSLSRKEAEESGVGHREAPSAESIVPEFQDLEEGDTGLDGPPGTVYFTVRLLQPKRALVFYSDSHARYLVPKSIRENPRYGIHGEFSWAFVLERQGEGVTRLILRTRAKYAPRLYRALTLPLILVGGEIFTARKMLYGIKRRVEDAGQRTDDRPASNIEGA